MASQETPTTPDASRQPEGRASYRAGFAFGTLSFVAVAIAGVISTILTSRIYGVRTIGKFALIMAPVSAMWVLSSVKEQQALIKEITGLPPRHPRVTQLFAVVFSFSTALTAFVGVLAAAACWFVFRGPLHQPELVAAAFVNIAGYALVTNTCWNVDSILSAFVAGRQIFWVRLHEALSFIAMAVAIGLVWPTVWGLVIATIGSSATSLVHRAIAARAFVRPRLTWREFRSGLRVLPELLRFGLRATPGQIAQGASQQGGIWAVGLVAPVTLVGAYSRAQTVPQRLQQVGNRITEVLYPTLVHRHTSGDGHGFDRALVDSVRYQVVGLLLIAAAIGGAAHLVMELFGPGFSRATVALALLAVFPALAAITATQTQALWATNRPGRTSLIAMARLAVTLTLLVVLTPRIGISGPAIALLVGYVVVVILSGIMLRPMLRHPLRRTWPVHERLALLVAYAAGFGAAHWTEHAARWSGAGTHSALGLIVGILASFAAGTLAYGVAFLACRGLNARDRSRLGDVVGGLRARRGRAAAPAIAATPAAASAAAGVQLHVEELEVAPGEAGQ